MMNYITDTWNSVKSVPGNTIQFFKDIGADSTACNIEVKKARVAEIQLKVLRTSAEENVKSLENYDVKEIKKNKNLICQKVMASTLTINDGEKDKKITAVSMLDQRLFANNYLPSLASRVGGIFMMLMLGIDVVIEMFFASTAIGQALIPMGWIGIALDVALFVAAYDLVKVGINLSKAQRNKTSENFTGENRLSITRLSATKRGSSDFVQPYSKENFDNAFNQLIEGTSKISMTVFMLTWAYKGFKPACSELKDNVLIKVPFLNYKPV